MPLADDLLAALQHRGQTLCTAESLTGGMLCAQLTAAPGASQTMRGGVVAYMTDVKRDVLGVDPHVLAQHGAVSAQTALELARNASRLFLADWAIATTGVAGPAEQEGKPVGTVFVAVGGLREEVAGLHLNGDRVRIRQQSCAAGMALLHRLLE